MNRDTVITNLLCILNKVTGKEGKAQFGNEAVNLPLLCDPIGLGSTELVYLFLEVRDAFGVEFTAVELEQGVFKTIGAIADSICSK